MCLNFYKYKFLCVSLGALLFDKRQHGVHFWKQNSHYKMRHDFCVCFLLSFQNRFPGSWRKEVHMEESSSSLLASPLCLNHKEPLLCKQSPHHMLLFQGFVRDVTPSCLACSQTIPMAQSLSTFSSYLIIVQHDALPLNCHCITFPYY